MPSSETDPSDGIGQTPEPDAAGAGGSELTGAELAKQQARRRATERKWRRVEKRAARIDAVRAGRKRILGRRAAGDAGGSAVTIDAAGSGSAGAALPKPKLKKLRIATVAAGLVLLALVSWVFGVMMAVAQDLPELEARAQYDRATNSIVYASDGKTPLTTLTGNEKRILLDSGEIAPVIKQAVVAIEDQRFYDHRGIDFLGIGRALEQDVISGGAVQGASTITQQFVKNALEAQGDRTVLQKLREAAIAYQIERQWSKDRILTNYLNNIYFGHGAYGIEAAARTYFGSEHPGCGDAGDRCALVLRPEEAAMLAALISSPTAYDPATHPEAAKAQRNVALQKMRDLGTLQVSDEDFATMQDSSPPAGSQIEPPREESEAPYFTDWLRQQVVDKYGPGRTFGGGLKITSTLDLDLQRAAEEAVSSRLGGLGPTSAVVVLDNGTADVLAMVGGEDFNDAPFNLATNGQRQPGSSFKPFTLVTALGQGYSPDKVYESAPQEIPFKTTVTKKNGKKKEVTDLFRVGNYGDKYLGSASIATATTYSDNSVYAQLGTEVGVDNVVGTAHDLGITSKLDDNPALILGGLEDGVTPLEMAYAYNTLANGGEKVSGTEASKGNGEGPVAIEKVTAKNANGEAPVPDSEGGSGVNEKTAKREVDPTVASTATDILHTVVTEGTGQRAQVGDDYIWGKTGTTDNNADAWFVGANEDITVAVWVGYPDGTTPMTTEFGGSPVDGGTIPALIWNDVVTAWDSEQAARDTKSAAAEQATETTTTTAPPVAPTTTAPEEQPAPAPEPEPAPAPTPTPEPAEPAPTPAPDPQAPAPPATGNGGTGGATGSGGGAVP